MRFRFRSTHPDLLATFARERASRSLWQRAVPNLLALAIAGVGVGGALRIVQAQDTPAAPPAPAVPPTPAAPPAPAAPTTPAVLSTDDVRPASAPPAPPFEPVAPAPPAISRAGADTLLSELLRQRAALDTQIAQLRAQHRQMPNGMTGEQKRLAEDAMQQARAAMKLAQEAMRQALRALPQNSKGTFVFPNNPESRFFFMNPKGLEGWNPDSKEWQKMQSDLLKQWKSKMPQFQMNWNQKDWDKTWKQMQPQLEQQMRELREQMKQWQKDAGDSKDKRATPEEPAHEGNRAPDVKPDSGDNANVAPKPTGTSNTIRITMGDPNEAI